jgi:hypothetical protein
VDFPLPDLPGKVYPPNISPDKEIGAGTWTDDQLARAIREGIGLRGKSMLESAARLPWLEGYQSRRAV